MWFHSLDCNQPLAVEFAKRGFHLPYRHASMACRTEGDATYYRCRRRGVAGAAEFRHRPDGPASAAAPGSLEFFLAERYLLYSSAPDGRLFEGRVHHSPYQLAPARCAAWSGLPAAWDGLPVPGGPPESALWVDHVDVEIFPLRRLA